MSALFDLNAFLDESAQTLRSVSAPGRPTSDPSDAGWKPPTTINGDDTVCNICQEEYNKGSQPEIPLTLPCGHAFGSVCIAQWLHVRNRDHGCPVCRNMPFGRTRQPGGEDLEDGEITEDEDEAMSETSDSVETVPGFSRNRAAWEYYNNDAGLVLVRMGDELTNNMRIFLGRYPSSELITQMLRTGDTRDLDVVLSLMLSDHRPVFEFPRSSYRLQTTRLYAKLKGLIEQAATWLRARATDYVLRELLARLELSQQESAQVFRNEDKETLSLLIKAGLFHSRRMDGSFSLRMTLARHVPSEFRPFEDTGHPAGTFVHRVVNAMPRLTAAYQAIIDTQVNNPSTIPEEIKFMELWDADMAPGSEPVRQWTYCPPLPLIRTRQPVESSRQTPSETQSRTVRPSRIAQAFDDDGRPRRLPSLSSQLGSPPRASTLFPGATGQNLDLANNSDPPSIASNAERPTLAANDPFSLPSLADLEARERELFPSHRTGRNDTTGRRRPAR